MALLHFDGKKILDWSAVSSMSHNACRVAKNLDGAKELIEAGFEYVTDMDDIKLFRKQK